MSRFRNRLAAARHGLRHNDSGAAAVEFALVAVVFFWLFLGLVELGVLMIFNNGLEDGIDRAARLLRTGQVHKQDIDEEKFRQIVCDQVVLKTDCASKLIIDVRSYPDFASISNPPVPTYNDDGELEMPSNYTRGMAEQVLLVRAFYEWEFFTPMLGALLSNTQQGTFLVTAATTFRTEPYTE